MEDKVIIDKNSGDDWGEKGDSYMTAADTAEIIVNAFSSPGSIQIDTLEFKKTNWDE